MLKLKNGFYLLTFLSLSYSACLFSNQLFITALPKSGLHLLAKGINLLANKQQHLLNKERVKQFGGSVFELNEKILSNLKQNEFYFSHAACIPANISIVKKRNMKGIYIYRDPRDHLVSVAYWIYNHRNAWPDLAKLNIDDLLLKLINNYGSFRNTNQLPNVKSLVDGYNLYYPWRLHPEIYTTTFERLVGPQGGGSKELQRTEIKNIAKHLKIEVTDRQIDFVANNIFGDYKTFRDGQIGSWKKHFKEHHKNAFKKNAGELLIKLLYEKDFNW